MTGTMYHPIYGIYPSHLKISGCIYDLTPDCLRCGLLKVKCWEKIPNSSTSVTLAQYCPTDY